jgi:hypothetical protein
MVKLIAKKQRLYGLKKFLFIQMTILQFFLFEFSSYMYAKDHFKCSRQTIANNIDTNKLFKENGFYFLS